MRSQGRIDVMPSWESDIQAGAGLSPMRLAQGSQGCDVKFQSGGGKSLKPHLTSRYGVTAKVAYFW